MKMLGKTYQAKRSDNAAQRKRRRRDALAIRRATKRRERREALKEATE